MNIAVVIPAYNESKNITEVLKELQKTKYKIYVVDDGSKDDTLKIAKKHKVFVLRHKVNLGKGAALKTGCEAAFLGGAEAIIMMDADGQHSIRNMNNFVDELEGKKVDVVFGSRNLSLGVPLVRYLGNKFASILINLMFGIYISDLLCGYRAITKKAYQKINWQSSGYGVETEMVVRTGSTRLKYTEVLVDTVYLDKFKGVTIIDAFGILKSVIVWRLSR